MAKLILSLAGEYVEEYKLVQESTRIGRRPHNDIQVDHLAVSGEHAVVRQKGQHYVLNDLDSTNGVTVNGQRVSRHVLQDGDQIRIGKHIFRFCVDNKATFAPASAKPFEKTVLLMPPGSKPLMKPSAPAPAPVASKPAAPVISKPAVAPAAASVAVAPPAAVPARKVGVVKVLTGANAGRELVLNKPSTTLGRTGSQVAVITRQPQGYVISHVEGPRKPCVNGHDIDMIQLKEEDLIELVGVKMAFFFRDQA
ncbi:FHA domain-containing protein [Amantichitinum ursilacus]|uniref:Transcriptional regulatory protein EmbR n=1 Tax=Amantichitinum ursilacus TaxID=857265 RepID=A0A0N0GQ62_9NEIS|nr:FHA domain-containing protein [Amantichitinum ursilacus]KPC54133.1 Transcriptional regulatory protein EmbR [Amantichitinum ursilacus]